MLVLSPSGFFLSPFFMRCGTPAKEMVPPTLSVGEGLPSAKPPWKLSQRYTERVLKSS